MHVLNFESRFMCKGWWWYHYPATLTELSGVGLGLELATYWLAAKGFNHYIIVPHLAYVILYCANSSNLNLVISLCTLSVNLNNVSLLLSLGLDLNSRSNCDFVDDQFFRNLDCTKVCLLPDTLLCISFIWIF